MGWDFAWFIIIYNMDNNHPLYAKLHKYRIILASQSPRRKQLMSGMDIPFEIIVKQDIEENFPDNLSKIEIPEYLAIQKADAYQELKNDGNNLIITSDTIVWLHAKVIGKPERFDDAVNILQQLSGQMHEVVTGVALTARDKQKVFHAITKVWIRDLSEEEIVYYLEKYQPFDKAGAYGIQEWIGYAAVEKIEGSFHNVMGLPVQMLYKELLSF